MIKRLSSREVDDRAAEWAARVDAEPLNAAEQSALEAWLCEDARHFGSYAKARAVLAYADRAKALGPEFIPQEFRPEEFRPGEFQNASPSAMKTSNRRRFMLLGSVAACIAVLGVAGEQAGQFLTGKTFNTRIGETKVVSLEDGSIVTLNTNSEIDVRYTENRRDIRLVRGEALFDVAKNRKRPFIVDANGTLVRAVGTSFTVSLLPSQPVLVLVREGKVEVTRHAVDVAPAVYLVANSKALAPAHAPIRTVAVAPSEVARALSWKIGRLSFEGESLREAAATFARYSDIHIEIDDPSVANQTVTGLFVSNDPVGFSKAVALSLGLHAEIDDNAVRLTR